MTVRSRLFLMAAAGLGLLACAGAAAAAARQAEGMDAATGAALQGDAARARDILLATPLEALDERDRRVRACIIDRFAPGAPPLASAPAGGLAAQVLSTYRTYWQAALTRPEAAAEAEEGLRLNLTRLLSAPEAASLDDLSDVLEARLKAEGWGSLRGRTGRLRELMLWRGEEVRQEPVALPEGPFVATVVLLSDFASLGWADYATCGRRGAGGWATPDRLYAVTPRYRSLDGEEFRVTFLGHETQHFADLRRWPELEPWRLEYRAKLVELAQVEETRDRVLTKFLEDRRDDPVSPHAYANLRLVRDLTARMGLTSERALFDAPIPRLNAAATALLTEDTARLTAGR